MTGHTGRLAALSDEQLAAMLVELGQSIEYLSDPANVFANFLDSLFSECGEARLQRGDRTDVALVTGFEARRHVVRSALRHGVQSFNLFVNRSL